MHPLHKLLFWILIPNLILSGCAPRLLPDLSADAPPITLTFPSNIPTQTSVLPFTPPATQTEAPPPQPIRAVGVSYAELSESRAQVQALQDRFESAGINMVGLTAGRVDWTYFRWEDHPEYWSSALEESGIDFFGEDCVNFDYGHINAILDIYAPNYIAAHPEAAAVSYWGEPSDLLVSTAALTSGPFHDLVLEMIEYIAATYPVDSISITELSYRIYGYGEDDLALFRAYTGGEDWPRDRNGNILFEHPTIGEWRSEALAGFLAEAAEIVHAHGKELFFDVSVSWGRLENEGREYGHHYGTILKAADRIIVWGYTDLAGYPPSYAGEIAAYLEQTYDTDQVIFSIGLWGPSDRVITPEALGETVSSAIDGGIPYIWVTPSSLMTEAHWQRLIAIWRAEESR